jgi:hypothetical protein
LNSGGKIRVSDYSTRLLAKIEELTLYAIDQNKQIQELKQIASEQQQRIDALIQAASAK